MASKRTLLIVNHDGADLQVCKNLCLSLGFEVQLAQSNDEAFRYVRTGQAQIVISMATHSSQASLELCMAIRHDRQVIYTYFIHVSPSNSEDAFHEATLAQVDEHLALPLNPFQLTQSLHQAFRLLESQNPLFMLDSEVSEQQRQLENKLYQIKHLQTRMQTKNLQRVFGACVHFRSWPMSILSGDQSGVFEASEGVVGFFMVDVVGHGISAAVRAMGVSRMFSKSPLDSVIYHPRQSPRQALELRTTSDVISILNSLYPLTDEDPGCVCAAYGLFDTRSKTLSLTLAGMPPPYLIRANGSVEKMGVPDLPLGIMEDYSYQEVQTQVDVGDQLFLYTDGLTEVRNANNEPINPETFDDLMSRYGHGGFMAIQDGLRQLIMDWSGRPQHHMFSDDATLLCIDLFHDSKPDAEKVAGYLPANKLPTVSLNNLSGFIRKALLLFDEYSPTHKLFENLNALKIHHSSHSLNHIPQQLDSLLEGVNLILIEAGNHSDLTWSWLKQIRERMNDEPPYIILCHHDSPLAKSREWVESGADRIVQVPCSYSEIRFHLETCSRHIQIQRAVGLTLNMLKNMREEIRDDVQLVAIRQLRTLPREDLKISGISNRWIYKPAKNLSGDFMALFPVTSTQVGFFALDGEGHGITICLKAWAISNLIRGMDNTVNDTTFVPDGLVGLKTLGPPSVMLKALNSIVMQSPLGQGLHCAITYGVIDSTTGKGLLCNAGNPPALLGKANGKIISLNQSGVAIGTVQDPEYTDVEFELEPSGRLILHSDGICNLIEQCPAGEGLSTPLAEWLGSRSGGDIDRLKQDLNMRVEQLAPHGKPEDVSVLILERA